MDKQSVKLLVEKEIGSQISERQEKLVEGLLETYVGITNLGLDALSIIYRSGIEESVTNKYKEFMATNRQEELSDKFLLSVFCLVVSRPVNSIKLKI